MALDLVPGATRGETPCLSHLYALTLMFAGGPPSPPRLPVGMTPALSRSPREYAPRRTV